MHSKTGYGENLSSCCPLNSAWKRAGDHKHHPNPPHKEGTSVNTQRVQGWWKETPTIFHMWPEAHTVTTYYRVEVDSDKVKLDEQHREYRWINKMEDDLHPYIKEMIENTGLFR